MKGQNGYSSNNAAMPPKGFSPVAENDLEKVDGGRLTSGGPFICPAPNGGITVGWIFHF